MDDDILLTVEASAPRRMLGLATLALLGALLLYLAATYPPGAPGLAFLLGAAGVGALMLCLTFHRATQARLELTAEALRSSDGRIIARIADIVSLDRGAFAHKPSNGFLLRLGQGAPLAWAPGIWWRVGRRVGVGGVLSAPASRLMAETITAMLAERQGR
jgi:hypothetical protein